MARSIPMIPPGSPTEPATLLEEVELEPTEVLAPPDDDSAVVVGADDSV
jgi:hypothetical protein